MSERFPGMPPPPPPAEPRLAAVVVLYRRTPFGVEVFWVKRERALAFAGGFYAFPGGKVDPRDASVPVAGASERVIDYSGYSATANAVLQIERELEPFTWTLITGRSNRAASAMAALVASSESK